MARCLYKFKACREKIFFCFMALLNNWNKACSFLVLYNTSKIKYLMLWKFIELYRKQRLLNLSCLTLQCITSERRTASIQKYIQIFKTRFIQLVSINSACYAANVVLNPIWEMFYCRGEGLSRLAKVLRNSRQRYTIQTSPWLKEKLVSILQNCFPIILHLIHLNYCHSLVIKFRARIKMGYFIFNFCNIFVLFHFT